MKAIGLSRVNWPCLLLSEQTSIPSSYHRLRFLSWFWCTYKVKKVRQGYLCLKHPFNCFKSLSVKIYQAKFMPKSQTISWLCEVLPKAMQYKQCNAMQMQFREKNPIRAEREVYSRLPPSKEQEELCRSRDRRIQRIHNLTNTPFFHFLDAIHGFLGFFTFPKALSA